MLAIWIYGIYWYACHSVKEKFQEVVRDGTQPNVSNFGRMLKFLKFKTLLILSVFILKFAILN